MNISPYVIPGLKFFDGLPELSDKLNFIESMVTSYFGETIEGIKKKSRIHEKVICRHICYYLMKRHTNLSLVSIGKRFKNSSDHTTVIHGINSLNDLMDSDPKLREDVQLFEAKIDERK